MSRPSTRRATHPNAAKLWEEYLYSDEGQLLYLKGYCNPIRYDDLSKRGVVPADLAAKLPDSTGRGLPDAGAARCCDHAHHQGLGRGHGRESDHDPGTIGRISAAIWLL